MINKGNILITVVLIFSGLTFFPIFAEDTVITITGEPNPIYGKIHHYIINVEGKLYNDGISQFGTYAKDDPSKSGQQFPFVLVEGENQFGLNLLDYGDYILPFEKDKTYVMEIINLNNVGTFEFTPRYPDDPRRFNFEYESVELESQLSPEEIKQREIECEKQVDKDDSLTYAEKIVQKNNCETYGDRFGEISDCPSFEVWLQTAEAQGTFVSNIVDLGTIMHIKGIGACNADVEMSFQKKGSPAIQTWSVSAPSSGVFGDQFFFTSLSDLGDYILKAKKVKTGEEISLEFSVMQLDNPPKPLQGTFFVKEETNEQINKLKTEIEELKKQLTEKDEQIEKKDAVLMEQVKVILELAQRIKSTIFEPIYNYFSFA